MANKIIKYNLESNGTIPTAGNATDFGNLSVARQLAGAASSHTRGLFACGNTPSYSRRPERCRVVDNSPLEILTIFF